MNHENEILAELVRSGRGDWAEEVCQSLRNANDCQLAWEKLTDQFNITSQDRDARRRRMELAQLILNYEQSLDVEAIWGVATGILVAVTESEYKQWQSIFLRPRGEPHYFGVPVGNNDGVGYADPTQQPTLMSTDDISKQPVEGAEMCPVVAKASGVTVLTCRYSKGHLGFHQDVTGTNF